MIGDGCQLQAGTGSATGAGGRSSAPACGGFDGTSSSDDSPPELTHERGKQLVGLEQGRGQRMQSDEPPGNRIIARAEVSSCPAARTKKIDLPHLGISEESLDQ